MSCTLLSRKRGRAGRSLSLVLAGLGSLAGFFAPALLANLAIPFAEGFESATAGTYTTPQDPVPGLTGVRFELTGNARLRTNYADGIHSGASSLTMDSSSGYARGDAIVQLDLSGYDSSCSLIELDFVFRDFGDENHQQAGAAVGLVTAVPGDDNDWVFVRGSSSDPWIFAYNWGATASGGFKTLSTAAGSALDLRQVLIDAGQDYSATTEVMFRWYDNSPAPTDGVSFDDVQLSHTQLCSTVSGQLGIDGNATGLLGPYEDELAVPVQVELQDGVCSPRVDCPVATTDTDGIYTFSEVLSGDYLIDVYDDELPSDFILSVGADGDNATADPMPITVVNPNDRTMNFGYIGTPISLPYSEGFEGAGAEVYVGEHHRIVGVPHAFLGDDHEDGAGRMRVAAELAPGFYHSGSNAVTFDTDAATNQQNNLVFTFDMSAYDVNVDTVLLDFAWMHHGDENSSFDRDNIEVRGSTNDPWITLYDKGYAQQTAAPGVWFEMTGLDISDALLNHDIDVTDITWDDQQFSKTFQIRFRQYDNADATSLTGGDGASYDDICIYLQGGADCSGSEIGDRVWNDLDGDGVDDPGEPGIPDVTVTLLDDQGGTLDAAITDDTGVFKFVLQTGGSFEVVVTPPAGATSTFDPDGGADHRAEVVLAAVGDHALDVDFGYQFSGSLAGVVWDDRDADGAVDLDEMGIGGITVELRNGATTPRTTTTDGSGQFTIDGVGPGSWTLFLPTPPAGAVATHDPDDAGIPVSTPHRADFSLANGEDRAALDFGYRFAGSVAGSLWDDLDQDGIEDGGEPGLAGVTVTLELASVPVRSATTDSNGDYLFGDLPAGSYSVVIGRPPGATQTLDPDGTPDDRTTFSLAPSEARTGIDFAYHLQAAIGGRVWNDIDGDGVIGGGEAGLPGAALVLHDGLCSPGVDCPTATTDALGDFEFLGLSAGVAYDVVLDECTLPWAARSTDGANPLSRTLGPLEIVTDANFGYRAVALPYFEGFEHAAALQSAYTAATSCIPGAPGFSYSHDNLGRLRFAAGADMAVDGNSSAPANDYYRSGMGAATLDTSATGDTQNDLTLGLDLSAYSVGTDDLLLDFAFMDHLDESHPTDVVDMRIGASPWMPVFDWSAAGGEEIWTDVRDVNLSEVLRDYNTANATSYDFPDGFALRFRQFGAGDANYPSWGDGVSFDDVFLRIASGTASISGALWKDLDNDSVRDAGEGMPCVLLELYEDSNGNGVLDGAEGSSSLRSVPAGVGGAYDFSFLPAGSYLIDIVDSTLRSGVVPAGVDPVALSVAAGQTLVGADLAVEGGVVLPYSQDFESATEEVHWGDALCIPNLPDFEFVEPDDASSKATAGNARLDFHRGEGEGRPPCFSSTCDNQWSYRSGDRAATLDQAGNGSPDSQGDLILHLDLSSYDVSKSVTLDFALMHHGPLFQVWNDFDALVYARGSKDDPWLVLFDIEANNGCGVANCPAGQWRKFMDIDLSGVLQAGGQDFSATSQIRFYFLGSGGKYADDDNPWVQGGYTVDDIVINGPSASTFSGRVWNDADGGGTQNGEEVGLGGLQVELRNEGNDLVDQATTSPSGAYQLAALESGTFTVIVASPAGGSSTFDPDATLPSNHAVLNVPVVGMTFDDLDFGFQFTGSLAGTVFDDADGSGSQSGGEVGFAGLPVTLWSGAVQYGATVTDSGGNYGFAGLSPAVWRVVVGAPPAGTTATADPDGIATLHTADISVGPGQTLVGQDFGYMHIGSISGSVFDDRNGDATRDGGEDGFVGVAVSLLLGVTPFDTTVTDASGVFGFGALPPGNWRVVIDAPPTGTEATVDPDGLGTPHFADLALSAGEALAGRDFGYRYTGSIAGTVFDDADGSASQNGAEGGFAGTPVSLLLGATPFASTATAADGSYGFANLPPGTWTVVVDTPPVGSDATFDPDGLATLHRADVTLSAGQAAVGHDFGYRAIGTISGVVFDDTDGNGSQDGGDPGFAGVPVSLLDGATPVGSTTTSGDGSYSFSNLAEGTYTVRLVTPPAGTEATVDPDGVATLHTADVAITAGESSVGNDFGYRAIGTISGVVFDDADGNGSQDGGEPGFAGVSVSLLQGVTPVGSTVTSGDGSYSFSNLAAGTYTVRLVTPPAGTEATVDPDGVATLHTADVTITAGESSVGNDFGYRAIGTISGVVFDDADGNGSRDGGEPGFAGVSVSLLQGVTPVGSTVTSGDGSYSFTNLTAGTYTLNVGSPPAGTIATADPDGAGTPHTADVTITAGQIANGSDFGYRHSGSIAGSVFQDIDGSATRDGGEPGFASTSVSLLQGATPIESASTAPDGSFSFSNLPGGSYTLRIDIPPAGTNATVDPDGLATLHVAGVTLAPGEAIAARDFGYRYTNSIAGSVFDDADGSASRGAGESGFAGISVTILQEATAYESTTTAADGSFGFSNLPVGTWTVRVDAPPSGTTATVDPDGLGTPHQAEIALAAGQSVTGRDFGYRHTGQIAGAVFEDTDGSAAQNGAEPGFAGVPVSLVQGVTPVDTTTTGPDGSFSFSHLPAGTFTVVIDAPPAGTSATTDPDGLGSLHRADVAITAGQSIADRDFGYRFSGQIAGTVFEDADGNGGRNGTEAGFEGVPVSLQLGATPYDSTTTAVDGSFSFSNLPAGSFRILIGTPPAGTAATVDPDGTGTPHQAELTLTAGQSVSGRDFGYRYGGQLAGTVFEDTDGSAAQNGAEPGFDAVPVKLMEGANEVGTTTTDSNGDFIFENLAPGAYTLVIETPPAGTAATVDPDGLASLHAAEVTLTAGQALADRDFGYRYDGSIAGLVFEDTDGSEAQDGAEPGFDAVPVKLMEGANEVGATTTDSNGEFMFENLSAGTYTLVIETPPAGTAATVDPDGLASLHAAEVTLTAGQALADRDFGYRYDGSIAGLVFEDTDGSEAQDGAEPGFDAVPVKLMEGANEVGATTTDSNGEFMFENLSAGTYTLVIETPPAGTAATVDPDGLANLHEAEVTLAAGQSVTDQDFGYRASGSLAGSVFEDADGSADQNGGELGIESVAITLLLDAAPYDSTATAADGSFSFSHLPAGSFTVAIETPPASSQATLDPDGTATLHEAEVSLSAGESQTGLDFGYRFFGSIGDLVWEDTDLNGTQNGAEAGIAGVTLDLTDTSGTSLSSTTTGPSGEYLFSEVFAGEYRVQVTDSGGVLGGKTLCAGINPTADITVTAGTAHLTADFGFCTTSSDGSIGDLVFFDADADGNPTGSEIGLEMVQIELWHDVDGGCALDEGVDALVSTVTTDSQGAYLFDSLAVPATYLVRVAAGQALLDGFDLSVGFESPYCTTLTSVAVADGGADFGLVSSDALAIDGTVFLDASGDGVFDSGSESGVGGAILTLYRDMDGDEAVDPQDPVFGTAESQPDGDYEFAGLPGGGSQWLVQIDVTSTPVSGGVQTTQADSGGLEPVTLVSANEVGRDFGYTTSPTHALVTSFDVFDEGGQVVAEWKTTSEVGTVGFFLYRWEETAGEWSRVDDFVASAGSPLGATYRVADMGAHPGDALSYYLVEVELRGGTRYYGPFDRSASAGRGSGVLDMGATPHERDGVHLERSESRRLALVEGDPTVQRRQGTPRAAALRLTVARSGVHSVSSAQIAQGLEMSTQLVEEQLAAGGFALTLAGEAASWWSSDGRRLSFYAPEPESLFGNGLDFFLEPGDGVVARSSLSEATARVEDGSVLITRRFEENRFAAAAAVRTASQDFWFWRTLSTLPGADATTVDFDLGGAGARGTATLRIGLFGATDGPAAVDHRLRVWLNGRQVEVAQWDGAGAREVRVEVGGSELLTTGNQLRLELEGPDEGNAGVGIAYLDSVEIEYRRAAQVAAGLAQSVRLRAVDRAVTVGGFVDGVVEVLDVSDPLDPVRILATAAPGGQDFEVSFATQPGREYVATGESAVALARVSAVGVGAVSEAEYLIVAADELASSAQRLAELRRARGLKARVVTLEDLYDVYAGGEEDPWAIRAFLQQAWSEWQPRPRWVVLVGKGSYDFKDVLGIGGNLLPPPMASTAHGLFAADMLLGDVAGDDGIPEIAVGRIPVVTTAELDLYVDKLADWERGRGAFGSRVVLASDNADEAGDFPSIVDSMGNGVGGDLEPMRIDLGADGLQQARTDLLDALGEGALWMTYAGHGGVDRLAAEGLLTLDDVPRLRTVGQLPIVSALTCALNRYEVPGVTSLGEALVLDRDGGAIAVFAPTGLSQSSSAERLGGQLMRSALGVSASTLGEAILQALAASGVPPTDLATYTLLGDPALQLPEGQPAGDLIVREDFEAGELGPGWITH